MHAMRGDLRAYACLRLAYVKSDVERERYETPKRRDTRGNNFLGKKCVCAVGNTRQWQEQRKKPSGNYVTRLSFASFISQLASVGRVFDNDEIDFGIDVKFLSCL